MKIEKKHVTPLEKFTETDFALWLQEGFEYIKDPKRQIEAFRPLNYLVGHQDIFTELQNIYDLLPGRLKRRFRLGLKIILADSPPKSQSVNLISSVLDLTSRVHAVEVLPEVIKRVGNGFFGLQDNPEGDELFALAFDVFAGMSETYKAGNNIRKLISSSNFKSEYAPMAFIALCTAEPDNFIEHIALLRRAFSVLHSEKGTTGSVYTALRFVNHVVLETIGSRLLELKLSDEPSPSSTENDNWLVTALICLNESPLDLDKDDEMGVFFINRRDHDLIQIPIETDSIDDPGKLVRGRRFLNKCMAGQMRELKWARTAAQIATKPDIEKSGVLDDLGDIDDLFGSGSPLFATRPSLNGVPAQAR